MSCFGAGNTITVGNGNNDTVFSGGGNTIAVGNGNDTIHVGTNDTVTIGSGHDILAFDFGTGGSPDQSVPGGIGAVTITGFNPSRNVIELQQALLTTNPFSATDDAHGNAVVTFSGDTLDKITLVGVHSSALHASDFHFV